VRQLIN